MTYRLSPPRSLPALSLRVRLLRGSFPGMIAGYWSVDRGSASITGGHLTLAADSALSSDVLSPDGTPYGVVLAGVNDLGRSPADCGDPPACRTTPTGYYAFAEYRGDGTVRCGVQAAAATPMAAPGSRPTCRSWEPTLAEPPLTWSLRFQLCYTPTGSLARRGTGRTARRQSGRRGHTAAIAAGSAESSPSAPRSGASFRLPAQSTTGEQVGCAAALRPAANGNAPTSMLYCLITAFQHGS